MDEIEKGQIALALIRASIAERGLRNFNREALKSELGRQAKEAGVPYEDFIKFYKSEIQLAFTKLMANL